MNARLSQLNWRLLGLRGLVLLVGFGFFAIVGLAFFYPHYDFAFFYYAFDVVRNQQVPSLLYNLSHERVWLTQLGYGDMVQSFGHFDQYVYPPQFAVLLFGFAALPYDLASQLWEVCSVCAYGAGVYWMIQLACPQRRTALRMGLFVVAAFQLPYLWDFLIGNSNWLIFFLLALAFHWNHSTQRRWLAGIPLGLAVVFKVTPAVVLLYYLLRRDWRMPVGTLCTVVATTLISVWVVGWNTVWTYVTSIRSLSAGSMQNGPAPYNSSIYGVEQLWHLNTYVNIFHHPVNYVYVLLTVILIMVVAFTKYAHASEPRSDVALSTLCMLLVSPLIEGPHMVIALFSLLMVFSIGTTQSPPMRRAQKWVWWTAVGGVVVILSPIGWALRIAVPVEYFVALVILLLMSLRLGVRRKAAGV